MSPTLRLKNSFSQIANSLAVPVHRNADVGVAPDRAVDPVAILHRDAAEEMLRRTEAVLVDDRDLRHGEVDEHERGQHERVAPGDEEERGRSHQAPASTTRLGVRKGQSLFDEPPERQQRSGV